MTNKHEYEDHIGVDIINGTDDNFNEVMIFNVFDGTMGLILTVLRF